jgi:hypothetical protein
LLARRNLLRAALWAFGPATASPVESIASVVTPRSTPTARGVFGRGAAPRLRAPKRFASMPTRHRRAHDQSFKLIAPAIAPLETARAKTAKAIEELKKIIAGPTVELSDAAAIEIRTRLAGLPKNQRMAAIARSIAKGSDAIVAALLGAGVDRFLSENILNDIEIDAVRRQWALARHPDEVARLAVLEKDERALAIGGAALQTFQRGCSDPAIVAGGLLPNVRAGGTSRGAPGPVPVSRAATVADRAKAFTYS